MGIRPMLRMRGSICVCEKERGREGVMKKLLVPCRCESVPMNGVVVSTDTVPSCRLFKGIYDTTTTCVLPPM